MVVSPCGNHSICESLSLESSEGANIPCRGSVLIALSLCPSLSEGQEVVSNVDLY